MWVQSFPNNSSTTLEGFLITWVTQKWYDLSCLYVHIVIPTWCNQVDKWYNPCFYATIVNMNPSLTTQVVFLNDWLAEYCTCWLPNYMFHSFMHDSITFWIHQNLSSCRNENIQFNFDSWKEKRFFVEYGNGIILQRVASIVMAT